MQHSILIADDEKVNLLLIEKMLLQNGENYNVLKAANGKEACQLAKKYLPDLILLDWDMPVMSGIEAIHELKSNFSTKHIPIIMETGLASSENLQEALNAGAMDYIIKPIDRIELLARIKSALLLHESIKEVKYQKKRVEEHIDELNKLSLIIKQTANSVILISPQGEIEWANDSFEKLYGYSFDEFIREKGSNFLDTSYNKSEISDKYNELIKNKHSVSYITNCIVKNGTSKWIQTTLTPIFDGDTIEKIVAIETDITTEKIAEIELVKQNTQMKALTESLQKANIELEQQKQEILLQKQLVDEERRKTEDLLSNILPHHVVMQLKSIGYAKPRNYKMATVMFTDFKGFTKSCEHLTPDEIVTALHTYFSEFDGIILKHFIEKIKTIGDSYMCAGGVPLRNRSNPFNVVLAGLEIQNYIESIEKLQTKEVLPNWKLRIGIHTGELIAGVVGKVKFAYDIWGDTVNIAKRIESACEVGKVNVSEATYNEIKDYFDCEYRGAIDMKNRGDMNMYFVKGLKAEYAVDETLIFPNEEFLKVLNSL
jgi:PAS domain S-box-containing protein